MALLVGYFDGSVGVGYRRAAGILFDDGEEIFSFCENLKVTPSVKTAEYRALVLLLEGIQSRGLEGVVIYGDEREIIRVLNGRYRTRWDHKRYKVARRLLKETKSGVRRCPRTQNLANKIFKSYIRGELSNDSLSSEPGLES